VEKNCTRAGQSPHHVTSGVTCVGVSMASTSQSRKRGVKGDVLAPAVPVPEILPSRRPLTRAPRDAPSRGVAGAPVARGGGRAPPAPAHAGGGDSGSDESDDDDMGSDDGSSQEAPAGGAHATGSVGGGGGAVAGGGGGAPPAARRAAAAAGGPVRDPKIPSRPAPDPSAVKMYTDDLSSDDEVPAEAGGGVRGCIVHMPRLRARTQGQGERNVIGNVPLEWYREHDHIGYDIAGQRIARGTAQDGIDRFLKSQNDPNFKCAAVAVSAVPRRRASRGVACATQVDCLR
jgi:hypothetical protein